MIVLYLYTHFQALSFMFKIDEFCPLCFHIIHVLSFRPNPISFSVKFSHVRGHFCQIKFGLFHPSQPATTHPHHIALNLQELIIIIIIIIIEIESISYVSSVIDSNSIMFQSST
ncbi:hypothetical protein Hanom_Chr04g00357581 [Helianthus anomalus]